MQQKKARALHKVPILALICSTTVRQDLYLRVVALVGRYHTAQIEEHFMAERPLPAISRPVFDRTITVYSEQALRVVRRVFPPLVRSLYAIDVILRIIGEEVEIDAVEDTVSKMIGDCASDLEREKSRMEKLCTDNGVTEKPRYTHPMDFNARIVSPQVSQFVALIQMLDELMIAMDALWLCGVLTNKQCGQAHYQWQQRLLRLARRIITIERRAHRAAYAKGHGEAVQAAREDSGLSPAPEAILDREDPNPIEDNEAPPSAGTEPGAPLLSLIR